MKKIILVVFFLVTWTVERMPRFISDYVSEEDAYGRRVKKAGKDSGVSADVRQKTFDTLEEANKFIQKAPAERSEWGDRALDFHISRVEEIK